MKSVTNRALVAKKKNMYNQPTTEVVDLKTAGLMQGLVVSVNEGGGGNGTAGAPRRGDVID